MSQNQIIENNIAEQKNNLFELHTMLNRASLFTKSLMYNYDSIEHDEKTIQTFDTDVIELKEKIELFIKQYSHI